MARGNLSPRHRPHATRRLARRLVLVREIGTVRCWAAQLLDWSLAGCKLAGLPQRGGLNVGTKVEILEGLDLDSFEELTPFLAQPDLEKLDAVVERMRRQLGLRVSVGKIVRVEPKLLQFAVDFDEVTDHRRTYPVAQTRNPPLKASFTYRNSVGVLSVQGNLTPGAAIDLAKDVVNDVRQCLVVIDLTSVHGITRTCVEKFCTRLHSELNQEDLACALAVVTRDEWVKEALQEIKTYPTLQQAEQAIRVGLSRRSDAAARRISTDDPRSTLMETFDERKDSRSGENLP